MATSTKRPLDDLSELNYDPTKYDSVFEEEEEDDLKREGIWFYNGDDDFVHFPSCEPNAQVLSEITDEVVMKMKDARDEAAYDCAIVSRVENNLLKRIIQKTELKYDLMDGTIKESTVLFRLKSYRKKKRNDKTSRLQHIEPLLSKLLIQDFNQPKFPKNPRAAFYSGNMIKHAKRLLADEHPWTEEPKRYHHFAVDYVQLNEQWRRDFLLRTHETFLQQHGIDVFGFPNAVTFFEEHGWDTTKWKSHARMEYRKIKDTTTMEASKENSANSN